VVPWKSRSVSVKDATLPSGVTRLTSATDFVLPGDSTVVKFADGQLSATLRIPFKTSVRAGSFVLGLSEPKGAVLGARTQTTVKVDSRDTVKPVLLMTYGTPSASGVLLIGGTATDSGTGASGLNRVEYTLANRTDKGTTSRFTVAGDGKLYPVDPVTTRSQQPRSCGV